MGEAYEAQMADHWRCGRDQECRLRCYALVSASTPILERIRLPGHESTSFRLQRLEKSRLVLVGVSETGTKSKENEATGTTARA